MRRKTATLSLVALLLVAGAAFAANFLLTKTSETASTISFAYPAQAGADGYRYYAPGEISGETCSGTRLSRTFDPTRTTVTFSKVPSGDYCVEAIVIAPIGAAEYPVVAPPLPKQCADDLDNDGDGLVDLLDPGCTDAEDDDETNPPPVVAQWYLSPLGSDANPCTQPLPCASFQRAYTVANLGDTVSVAGGLYPPQTMAYLALKGSESDEPDVRFVAQGAVTIEKLTTYGARHTTFIGFDFVGRTELRCEDEAGTPAGVPPAAAGQHAVDVTFEGGGHNNLLLRGPQLLTFKNLEIGPSGTAPIMSSGGDTGDANCLDEVPGPTLFDHVIFHDMVEAAAASHMECLLVENTVGLTIRNSIFHRCSVFGILMKPQGAGAFWGLKDIVLENNFFGHPTCSAFRCPAGATSVSIYPATNLTVRGNTFGGAIQLRADQGTFTNAVVSGNLAREHSGSCTAPGVTWVGNAYSTPSGTATANKKCPNDVADSIDLNAGFVDPDTPEEWNVNAPFPVINYHLLPGAWPINKALPGSYPATDFDDQTRPVGLGPDIGADSREE